MNRRRAGDFIPVVGEAVKDFRQKVQSALSQPAPISSTLELKLSITIARRELNVFPIRDKIDINSQITSRKLPAYKSLAAGLEISDKR